MLHTKNWNSKLRVLAVSAKGLIHRELPFRRTLTALRRDRATQKTREVLKHLLTKEAFEQNSGKMNSKVSSAAFSPVIWTLWLQGFESAPDVVKYCQDKLHGMSPIPVKSLDLKQVLQIVDMPEKILTLHNSGNVTNVSLSDLIRLRLLWTYGGIWLDATVVVRDFEFLAGSRELPYGHLWWADCRLPAEGEKLRTGATWAMASSPESHLVGHALICFEELLQKTEGGFHYFDLFHVISILYESCEICHASIIPDDNEGYDDLHDSILKRKFSKSERIWKTRFMHKLNHKTFIFESKHRDLLNGFFKGEKSK